MRESMMGNRHRTPGPLLALLVVFTAVAGGCVVYEPVPVPSSSYGSSYDRVWNSALGAAEDAGVKITSADRATGTIQGVTPSSEVTILVISQADGRTRVEFSSKGPKGADAGLNERFTSYYNRRMGR